MNESKRKMRQVKTGKHAGLK